MADLACQDCEGKGSVVALLKPTHGPCYESEIACSTCSGLGRVSAERQRLIDAGNAHRVARIDRRETIRECAQRYGVSAVYLSEAEFGKHALPPQAAQEVAAS